MKKTSGFSINKFNWLYIVGVLAIVELISISLSFYLYQTHLHSHRKIVAGNAGTNEAVKSSVAVLSMLRNLMTIVDDAFEYSDVVKQRNQFNDKLDLFQERLTKLQDHFLDKINSADERLSLLAQISIIQEKVPDLREAALKTFSAIQQKDKERVRSYLAEFHRRNNDLEGAIEDLRTIKTEQQASFVNDVYLDDQSSQEEELIFSLVVFIVVMLVYFYVFRMYKVFKAESFKVTHLSEIVSSSQDAIFSFDKQGVIRSWNPAAESIFGLSISDAIGKSFEQVLPNSGVRARSWRS